MQDDTHQAEEQPNFHVPRAFRCKKCGHLEAAEHAGDMAVPLSCSCCGAGVVFRVRELAEEMKAPGVTAERLQELAALIAKCAPSEKRFDPDNWEVLADAASERLAELGLKHCDICSHDHEQHKNDSKKLAAVRSENQGKKCVMDRDGTIFVDGVAREPRHSERSTSSEVSATDKAG